MSVGVGHVGAAAAETREDGAKLESLSDEGADDTAAGGLVERAGGLAAQTLLERAVEQCVDVDLGDHLVERPPCGVVGHAQRAKPGARARRSPSSDDCFLADGRPGQPGFVEHAAGHQTLDDAIGHLAIDAAPGESLADLRDRQLPLPQPDERQPVGLGLGQRWRVSC